MMRRHRKHIFFLLSAPVLLYFSALCSSFSLRAPVSIIRSGSARTGCVVRLDPSSTDKEEGDTPKNELGEKAPPPGKLRRAFPKIPWRLLPNWLTYARCAAIPVLCSLFYLPNCHVATATIFAVASFTDWLDGFLARRWDVASDFGAFLDPVADKLMVSTALVLLSGRYGAVVALPTALILAREIAVSALREWMAQRGQRDSVQVGFQGKLKTALTMVSLTLLLVVPGDGAMPRLVYLYLPAIFSLLVCTAITLTSGIVYFRAAAPVFFGTSET